MAFFNVNVSPFNFGIIFGVSMWVFGGCTSSLESQESIISILNPTHSHTATQKDLEQHRNLNHLRISCNPTDKTGSSWKQAVRYTKIIKNPGHLSANSSRPRDRWNVHDCWTSGNLPKQKGVHFNNGHRNHAAIIPILQGGPPISYKWSYITLINGFINGSLVF